MRIQAVIVCLYGTLFAGQARTTLPSFDVASVKTNRNPPNFGARVISLRTSTTIRRLIVSVLFLATACRHQIPSGPPESELLYQQGLEAFRQATPNGYRTAINAFRQASHLIPSHCEYNLHLAESLLLLAQEQQINWEEYAPSVSEAASTVDLIQSNGNCSGFGAFLSRSEL